MPEGFWSRVQSAPIEAGELQRDLATASPEAGAQVIFTGQVRGADGERVITALELEHYPGMTEASLDAILAEVAGRWPLLGAAIVHRVGRLVAGETIVWVGVGAAHRGDAFAACECLMDYLKTRAPFWKKEYGPAGDRWVEPRSQDDQRAARWQVS